MQYTLFPDTSGGGVQVGGGMEGGGLAGGGVCVELEDGGVKVGGTGKSAGGGGGGDSDGDGMQTGWQETQSTSHDLGQLSGQTFFKW